MIWPESYGWLASWIAVVQLSVLDGTILYLIWRYLVGFLGGMSPTELKILQWKFGQAVELTAADAERLKEEEPELWEILRKL